VLAAALSFGFGDLIVPDIFTHLFDGVHAGKGLQGLLNSITIILSTPCEHIVALIASLELTTPLKVLSGGIVATILNLILPQEDLSPEDGGADKEEVNIEDAKDTHEEDVKAG
jgi:hypothetical protein